MPYFKCESCGFIASDNPVDATRLTRCPGCGRTETQPPESQLTCVPDSLEFDVPSVHSRRKAPPDKVGRFDIRRVLGRGGFGVVYLAWDPSLDREVAVKVSRHDRLGPSALEQMVFEARTAAQLRHANIVGIHEVQVRDQEVCIVADYIEGMTLSDRLKEGQPEIEKAVSWCIKLANALEHAHERQVVHRDLKPANILIDKNDEPMIADFGLARRHVMSHSGSHPSDTDRYSGARAGTPGYMSPEQAASMSQEATPASDIYSLGVILYEMLAGTRPFIGSAPEVIRATVLSDPPRLRKINRSVPRELEFVCMKCLEKAPERRYQSASELARDLELFLSGELDQGGKWASFRRTVSRLNRQRKPIFAGVLLTLAAGFGLWQFFAWKARADKLFAIYLETVPRGAEIVMIPVDSRSGQLRMEEAIRPPVNSHYLLTVPEGFYLVEASLPGTGVQQVYRTVSKIPLETISAAENQKKIGRRAYGEEGRDQDGRIILPRIYILPGEASADWVSIEGGEFQSGSDVLGMYPLRKARVEPYFLQSREVTFEEFRKVMGRLPITCERKGLKTGLNVDGPVHSVTFREAIEYAERIGARLPTLDEYLYAATNAGTTKFPWGSELPDKPEDVNWDVHARDCPPFDRTPGPSPVEGLYSRVLEWTETVPANDLPSPPGIKIELSDMRFVVGGGQSFLAGRPDAAELSQGPRWFHILSTTQDPDVGLGFRCAKSLKPRFSGPRQGSSD